MTSHYFRTKMNFFVFLVFVKFYVAHLLVAETEYITYASSVTVAY